MYTIISTELGDAIRRDSDGAFIPTDENNKDYIIYLEWIANGNTPNYE